MVVFWHGMHWRRLRYCTRMLAWMLTVYNRAEVHMSACSDFESATSNSLKYWQRNAAGGCWYGSGNAYMAGGGPADWGGWFQGIDHSMLPQVQPRALQNL